MDRPRVLVLALSGIGNLLMQTPLLRKLKDANPTAEITAMVAPRGTQEVLKHNSAIRNIFLGSPKPVLRERIGMIQAIQREKYDFGFVAYPGQLITSSSLMFFGAVPQRIGHHFNYYFIKNSGLFLTDAFPVQPVHDVRQNLNLLAALGLDTCSENALYEFPLSLEDKTAAKTFLRESKIRPNNKLIGMHPGTNKDMTYKRWPIERWAKLSDRLAKQFKAKILLFGNSDENALKDAILKQMRHKGYNINLSLSASAALIGMCDFFVSNDSGLMHVAVSQKIPTFGLFGPTDENRTAPWGPFGRVIRAAGTKPNYDVTRLQEIKKRQTADEAMMALDVSFVYENILNYFS